MLVSMMLLTVAGSVGADSGDDGADDHQLYRRGGDDRLTMIRKVAVQRRSMVLLTMRAG